MVNHLRIIRLASWDANQTRLLRRQFTYETRSSFLREYYNSPTNLVPRFFGNTTIHLRNSFLVSSGILQFTYETRSSFLREYYNSPTKLVPRFFGNTTIHLRNSFLVSSGIQQILEHLRYYVSASLVRRSRKERVLASQKVNCYVHTLVFLYLNIVNTHFPILHNELGIKEIRYACNYV
jgi:hypothetical protein